MKEGENMETVAIRYWKHGYVVDAQFVTTEPLTGAEITKLTLVTSNLHKYHYRSASRPHLGQIKKALKDQALASKLVSKTNHRISEIEFLGQRSRRLSVVELYCRQIRHALGTKGD